MKIKSINIASFGGLKNLTLDLNDNFNVIYGNNEDGKTTIMSFIKMMFYGNERGGNSILKNPRKKYTPWDGSIMAGSIDFEHSGKNYRLEREFRSSNSTDKATLIDTDLGERQSVAPDIGYKFFGISSAAFERSVFIGQFGGTEKDASAEGEINSKLSNIVSTGDETISYEAVNTRLNKAKLALMSKSGRAGEYDKNIKLISELEKKLSESELKQNKYESLKVEIHNINTEISSLQKSAEELKAKINSEQDIRNAVKLKEMLALKEKLDTLNKNLELSDGKLIDEVFVRKIVFCISKIENLEQKISAKSEEAKALNQSISLATNPSEDISEEAADKIKNQVETLKNDKNILDNKLEQIKAQIDQLLNTQNDIKNSKKPINVPILISAVIILCFTVAMFATGNIIVGSITAILTVAAFILSFVLRPQDNVKIVEFEKTLSSYKSEQNDLLSKSNDAEQNISSLLSKLETINAALHSSSALILHQKNLLFECQKQINEDIAEMGKSKQDLIDLFGRYRSGADIDEIKQELENITKKASEQKEIKQQLNYILKDIGNISYEEAREKLSGIEINADDGVIDFKQVKSQYDETLSVLTERKTYLATLVADAKACLSACEDPDTIKSEIKQLKERTLSQKEFCDTVDIAMQTLAESFAELRRSYGSVLEQKSSEIFKGITAGRYQSMNVSKSFDITAQKSGVFGGKELDYLSSGTADQAYLCLRLALAQLISDTAEPLPIMLDDALTQYDDNRIKSAIEFLNAYSANEQIIMFTCHNSIFSGCKDLGAKCIEL